MKIHSCDRRIFLDDLLTHSLSFSLSFSLSSYSYPLFFCPRFLHFQLPSSTSHTHWHTQIELYSVLVRHQFSTRSYSSKCILILVYTYTHTLARCDRNTFTFYPNIIHIHRDLTWVPFSYYKLKVPFASSLSFSPSPSLSLSSSISQSSASSSSSTPLCSWISSSSSDNRRSWTVYKLDSFQFNYSQVFKPHRTVNSTVLTFFCHVNKFLFFL